MVMLPSMGKLRRDFEPPVSAAVAPVVKPEVEDSSEDEHGPLHKRSKLASAFQQDLGIGSGKMHLEAMNYNLLDVPSPLGLRLRKSPSLLDLIQMRLSQASSKSSTRIANEEKHEEGKPKDTRSASGSWSSEKLKASNFPASLLRIGDWEQRVSRYEGDLVAKCYFAKHKLVWEVLDGGLKSKIEIQWSDIVALRATCPDNGPGTLDIVLSKQPLFFRETNPQPRKHTLWQATSDFTGGQASIHRQHFLQCPLGLLNRHFEKLIRCDPRLYALSHRSDVWENPYFETGFSIFDSEKETGCRAIDNTMDEHWLQIQSFQDFKPPCNSLLGSTKSEIGEVDDKISDVADAHPHSSGHSAMEAQVMDEEFQAEAELPWNHDNLNQFMSKSAIVNHIGHQIYKQINLGHQLKQGDELPSKETLEELSRYLASDSEILTGINEKSLISRVNSLCCLLQKDPNGIHSLQIDNADYGGVLEKDGVGGEKNVLISEAKPAGITRKESYGELLMHLPRIASFPQFLDLSWNRL